LDDSNLRKTTENPEIFGLNSFTQFHKPLRKSSREETFGPENHAKLPGSSFPMSLNDSMTLQTSPLRNLNVSSISPPKDRSSRVSPGLGILDIPYNQPPVINALSKPATIKQETRPPDLKPTTSEELNPTKTNQNKNTNINVFLTSLPYDEALCLESKRRLKSADGWRSRLLKNDHCHHWYQKKDNALKVRANSERASWTRTTTQTPLATSPVMISPHSRHTSPQIFTAKNRTEKKNVKNVNSASKKLLNTKGVKYSQIEEPVSKYKNYVGVEYKKGEYCAVCYVQEIKYFCPWLNDAKQAAKVANYIWKKHKNKIPNKGLPSVAPKKILRCAWYKGRTFEYTGGPAFLVSRETAGQFLGPSGVGVKEIRDQHHKVHVQVNPLNTGYETPFTLIHVSGALTAKDAVIPCILERLHTVCDEKLDPLKLIIPVSSAITNEKIKMMKRLGCEVKDLQKERVT